MNGVRNDTRANDGAWVRPSVRWWNCVLLLISGLAFPHVLPAQLSQPPDISRPLVDIKIEGNTTIPDFAILEKVKSQVNRPVDPEQVREDVRQLFASRWFFNVEPRYRQTDAGVVLVFKVLERPVVRSVRYVGNKRFKDKNLAAWTGLEAGSPFDVHANRESARRIQDRYREEGYKFSTVELVSGGKPDDRDIVFRITEGPKVRVASRHIKGAKFTGPARLRTKLATKAAIFNLGGRWNEETLAADEDALRQYYHNFGFFDVKIATEPKFSEDRSKVHVFYNIEEGPRYRIRKILLDGNEVLSNNDLLGKSQLKAGQFFDAKDLNKDVTAMRDKYGALGRLYAAVEPAPRFIEDEVGAIDLVYRIDESEVKYVRRINVHYESEYPHTRNSVVLDRSLVHPGDLADPKLIARTRQRLQGSQLFEPNVRIDVKPVDMQVFIRGQSIDEPPGKQPTPSGVPGFTHGWKASSKTPRPGHTNVGGRQ